MANNGDGAYGRELATVAGLFGVASVLKLLVLAPGLYRSTDFEVHRNWLAVTHARPLRDWYWEETSQWTLDYPPLFGYFQWALSQVAVAVEPDLVKITPHYDPSEAAVWFQRVSVMVVDVTLVLGVVAWCSVNRKARDAGVRGSEDECGGNTCTAVGALVFLNSGLFMVDHVHFQYNGFLLGLLLLSMGLIKRGRELLGGATFACLLMLKHLFLCLAPLYFVYLLRSYCYVYCDAGQPCPPTPPPPLSTGVAGASSAGDGGGSGDFTSKPPNNPEKRIRQGEDGVPQEEASSVALSLQRLAALGSAVVFVFGSALGPLCVSDGWTGEACMKQIGQLAVRLFPFGRGLVHAYWAPNVWALYLFADRVLLAALKLAGMAGGAEARGSTTGGLVRTEVMAVLPAVPAGVCLLLSVLACCPALWRAWRRPSPEAFAWGVVHCSLSAFLVGFHVHEKALLVPAVVSALLAFRSREAGRMFLRLSFLTSFAVSPLLPGPELGVLKVLLVTAHLALATSLLHKERSPLSSSSTASTSLQLPSNDEDKADKRFRNSSPPSSRTRSSTKKSSGTAHPAGRVSSRNTDATMGSKRRASGGVGVEVVAQQAVVPMWTRWDKVYVAGAVGVFTFAEVVHPWVLGGEGGELPFLPLMATSVYGSVGVVACWGSSLAEASRGWGE